MAEGGPSRSGTTFDAATQKFDVEIVREGEAWERASVGDELLERAAATAFASALHDRDAPCEVAILLTGDAAMQALNRQWRGKDAPTNVLSFPSGESDGHLGDVVLAFETVAREAEQQNKSIADHAAHLVVHGVLHLIGYDHDKEDEAQIMERLETKILSTLGVADPYGDEKAQALRKVSS
jgi:probable rRNA maturation factor